MRTFRSLRAAAALLVTACAPKPADVVLYNARVYTLSWAEPATDGTPAANAPYDASSGWRPDATAIAIRDGYIVYVGSDSVALALAGEGTDRRDLAGATVIPGLVDAHTHVAEWGAALDRLDLTGVPDEAAAIQKVVDRAATVPAGTWILGQGWDDGAWADRYPTRQKLSAAVPNHPVVLRGLHGFATWVNDAALAAAKITADTPNPSGGEIQRDRTGAATGLLLNRAVAILDSAVPPPTPAQQDSQIVRALRRMATLGYTSVHEAGTSAEVTASLERLSTAQRLPIRVYAMLSARDPVLMRTWVERGPRTATGAPDEMLTVRAVKAYYDGALGSRGAALLDDYSDRPGVRGVAGETYGFDRSLVGAAMAAGFQVGIHAIGDQGNRDALNYIDSVFRLAAPAKMTRPRIEHAQLVSPDDIGRFAELGVIASVQPPHAVEDAPWAEQRVGPERIRGAYAWRTLRQAGASLVFSADLPGSDPDPFYGLHAAVTRTDKAGRPTGGWYADQAMRIEEAIRGYTIWARRTAFEEPYVGPIAPGMWADLTVLDRDPFTSSAGSLLGGRATRTYVRGVAVQ